MKKILFLTLLSIFVAAHADAQILPRVSGQPALSKPKSASEMTLRSSSHTDSETALVRFNPLATSKIAELRARNAMPDSKMLQIGVHRDARTEAITLRDPVLVWKPANGGGLVAHIAINSPGALGLRVGMNIHAIPPGAEMRFSGTNNGQGATAVSAADEIKRLIHEQPVYWTPVTEGEQQLVEIYLPPGVAVSAFRFSIDSVSHLIVSPTGHLNDAKLGEAQSCNRDVACSAQTPGLATVAESVARMVFTGQCGPGRSTATCLCTGTLLSDFDASTQVPYFLTANHCISTQSEASTLVTFWGYESSSCGSGDLKRSAIQVAGGAAMLFNDPSNDAVLLRLNNPAPAGAYFSGWDPNALNTNDAVTVIHHPGGDVKKVSLGQVLGSTPLSNLGGTFTTVAYTSGATQGGSSGSGIFTASNGEYFLRGALYGGTNSCSNSGNTSDSFNRDFYSRLDQFYAQFKSYVAANNGGSATGAYSTTPASNASPPPAPSSLYSSADFTGAWGSSNGENGWGLSIVRGASGALGVIMYHYTPSRIPIWFIVQGGTFNGNTYSGQLYQFSGPGLNETYNNSLLQSQAVGSFSIDFSSAGTAVVSYNIPGMASASKPISKLNF